MSNVNQRLFNYMKEEHGVTLLESDINEIKLICEEGQSEQSARKSCHHACSPSDYYKGGKCDKMGCYGG